MSSFATVRQILHLMSGFYHKFRTWYHSNEDSVPITELALGRESDSGSSAR